MRYHRDYGDNAGAWAGGQFVAGIIIVAVLLLLRALGIIEVL